MRVRLNSRRCSGKEPALLHLGEEHRPDLRERRKLSLGTSLSPLQILKGIVSGGKNPLSDASAGLALREGDRQADPLDFAHALTHLTQRISKTSVRERGRARGLLD